MLRQHLYSTTLLLKLHLCKQDMVADYGCDIDILDCCGMLLLDKVYSTRVSERVDIVF